MKLAIQVYGFKEVRGGMSFIRSFRSSLSGVQSAMHAWLPLGLLVYLASLFLLDSSKQKTIFYLVTALPALALLSRVKRFSHSDPWAMASLLIFFIFFSVSALWSGGDGSVLDGLKFSLYIICLGLAVDAFSQRFSADFMAGFLVVVGGFAGLACWVAISTGDIPFSSLLEKRFTVQMMTGMGGDNPITSAVIFGLPVLAAWWLMARQCWQVQFLLVVVIAMCLGLMFFTKSRGPFSALAISLLLLSLSRRSRTDFVMVGVGVLLTASLLLLSSVGAIVAERAAEPNYRLGIWMKVLEQFRESWLLGSGFGSKARILIENGQLLTHSHSSLFEVFRQGGIVGGGLFLLMSGLLLKRSFRQPMGFFLLWLIYGAICLSTNGRMLLNRPSVEWFAFWLPLLLFYFSTRSAADRELAAGAERS